MLGVCSQEVIGLPALPLDSDIIFLSDFDGSDFATSAVDRSSKAAHISFFGLAHLDAVIKKFGTASYVAGGGSSGIKLPVDTDYTLITSNFTVETQVYAPTFSFNGIIAGVYGGSANFGQSQWSFQITGTTLRFSVWGTGGTAQDYAVGTHGMVGGQFYHIAACRCGAYIRIFVNGVMISKDIFPIRSILPNPSTIGLSIGNDWDLSGNQVLGNLDAMRITKKAWYRTDASFTPPTAPYGTIGPSFFVDQDTFYAPRMTPYFLTPGLVIDSDTFHRPTVSPQTVAPSIVVTDTDVFFAPKVNIATHWDTTYSACALSGANLVATNNAGTSTTAGAVADVGHARVTGLLYIEMTATSVGGADYGIGVVVSSFNYGPLGTTGSGGIELFSSGRIRSNDADLGLLMPAMASGDVYGIAMHLGRSLIWFKKVNGTPGNWNGDPLADPNTVTGGIAIPAGSFVLPVCTMGGAGGSGSDVIAANFGQASFVGPLPSGYERGYVA